MRWITVGPPDQPGTSIVLYPPAASPGVTDDERRTIVEMIAKGTFAGIILAIADLDGVFARGCRPATSRSSRSRPSSHPGPRWLNSSPRTLNARHHRTAANQTEVNCDETADRARQGAGWAGEPSPTPPAPVVGA
jgi:hypothetical protein